MYPITHLKKELTILAITGALAVGIGAFGAHGLKPLLSESAAQTFQTGVQYHFYHSLAMGLMFIMYLLSGVKLFRQSFYFFFIGIIFFSGSLYLLSTAEISGFMYKSIAGPVTPAGGLFFIMGWVNLIRFSFSESRN